MTEPRFNHSPQKLFADYCSVSHVALISTESESTYFLRAPEFVALLRRRHKPPFILEVRNCIYLLPLFTHANAILTSKGSPLCRLVSTGRSERQPGRFSTMFVAKRRAFLGAQSVSVCHERLLIGTLRSHRWIVGTCSPIRSSSLSIPHNVLLHHTRNSFALSSRMDTRQGLEYNEMFPNACVLLMRACE